MLLMALNLEEPVAVPLGVLHCGPVSAGSKGTGGVPAWDEGLNADKDARGRKFSQSFSIPSLPSISSEPALAVLAAKQAKLVRADF